jgi:hypothetical protein
MGPDAASYRPSAMLARKKRGSAPAAMVPLWPISSHRYALSAGSLYEVSGSNPSPSGFLALLMGSCALHRELGSEVVSCMHAGRTDGKFQIFETLTWRSELGSHEVSGLLIDALWSGSLSLPSFILVCSKQLVAVHFTEPAPSLHVQFMALAAPQVWDDEVNSASTSSLPSGRGVCLFVR